MTLSNTPETIPETAVETAAAPARVPRVTISRGTSEFSELAQRIRASGLMRRRYGYYWTKLLGVPLAFAAASAAFVWIGDTWWQLFTAVALAVLFTQIGLPRPRCRAPADLPFRHVERLDQPDRRQPVRRHELRLVAAQAHPPSRQPEQDRVRPRHRSARALGHPRPGRTAAKPTRCAGSSRIRACSSSRSCCSRGSRCTPRACAGCSRATRLPVAGPRSLSSRFASAATSPWSSSCSRRAWPRLPRPCSWACSASTWACRSRRTTRGCRWSRRT